MCKTKRRLTVSAWTALYIVIPRVCAVSLSSFYPSDNTTIAPTNMSPQITTSPGDAVYLRGESPQFTCTATGLPLPSISWLRDGSALSTGAKYSITSTSDDSLVTSTLIVLNLVLTDTGTFTCSASNSEGTVSSSYTLTVEGT